MEGGKVLEGGGASGCSGIYGSRKGGVCGALLQRAMHYELADKACIKAVTGPDTIGNVCVLVGWLMKKRMAIPYISSLISMLYSYNSCKGADGFQAAMKVRLTCKGF